MGRPVSLADNTDYTGAGSATTWARNAQDDYTGRITSLETLLNVSSSQAGPYILQNNYKTESMAYHVNGQLNSLNWSYSYRPYGYPVTFSGGVQYVYSATQNNGQITQAADSISGETITYQYDALRRMVSAGSTPNTGSSTAAWTQTFQYDGFGNLTAKALNGTSTPIAVNSATNRLVNANL